MTVGKTRFNGDKLKEAREARGLTGIALGELIGISRQAISQLEHGKTSPNPDTLQNISKVLNLPIRFFSLPSHPPSEEIIYYRSLSAATKFARTKVERRFYWLKEIVSYLRKFLKFPAVNIPNIDVPRNPLQLGDEEIEEIAGKCRRFWHLGDGPISNVAWLLENNGVIVARHELEAHTLDAFSEFSKSDSTPYIILGADKETAVRSRFDPAHELGHLVLHRHIESRMLGKPAEFKLIETQAHRFAGAFLLPANSFSNELFSYSLESFRALKPRWRVSIAMMIMRAKDIGLIDKDRYQYLFKQYSLRRWRTHEPLDDELEVEQPRLLRRSFEVLLNNKVQTKEDILEGLPFASNDIEMLTGLPRGFLRESPPSIQISDPRILPFISRQEKQSQVKNDNTEVVEFPRKF